MVNVYYIYTDSGHFNNTYIFHIISVIILSELNTLKIIKK